MKEVLYIMLGLLLAIGVGTYGLTKDMKNAQQQECYILAQEIEAGDYTQEDLDQMPYYKTCGLGE